MVGRGQARKGHRERFREFVVSMAYSVYPEHKFFMYKLYKNVLLCHNYIFSGYCGPPSVLGCSTRHGGRTHGSIDHYYDIVADCPHKVIKSSQWKELGRALRRRTFLGFQVISFIMMACVIFMVPAEDTRLIH